MFRWIIVIYLILFTASCANASNDAYSNISKSSTDSLVELPFDTAIKVVHILVALCDNQYQGIVPVPATIGNGQNPSKNLYWGAQYGIKKYFKLSKEWKLLNSANVNDTILERCVYKHQSKNVYLVADAYDGQFIKETTIDFLKSLSGELKDTLHILNDTIGINANARLISYIGHNGLMDFQLDDTYQSIDGIQRDCIILACKSKQYFAPFVNSSGARPLIWTTQFMAPEAYTIHDALSAYLQNADPEIIHLKAAQAYSKFQKCSVGSAKKLLVTN